MSINSYKQLISRIDHLADTILPEKAASPETSKYPVRFDHCFRRIAYDYATGEKWDKAVERPFYKNATQDQLRRALQALRLMRHEPKIAEDLNDQSLSYR